MLCWPLFSTGSHASMFAALIPGINIIQMLLVGLGIWKDEATVKSMTRFGDYRELLKGPLFYAATITFSSIKYWRTSPISIAAICNLCAGDGNIARVWLTLLEGDLVARRYLTTETSPLLVRLQWHLLDSEHLLGICAIFPHSDLLKKARNWF